MTLIDSHSFHFFANSFGTLLFVVLVAWVVWFASRME